MSYEKRIRAARPRMSKSFARLADYLLDDYVQVALMTASELAHEVDVDAATVVRFSQSLDYSGFPELQRDIRERLKEELLIGVERAAKPASVGGVAEDAMLQLNEALEQTRKLMSGEVLTGMVERIGKARRVIILPDSVGQTAAQNLGRFLGFGGFIVTVAQSDVTDLARTVSSATEKDLVLALDITGDAPYIARALGEARSRGVPTAAVVGTASLESAGSAEVVLAARRQPKIGVSVVVVNALIYSLVEALRWRYPKRFEGSSEVVEAIFERIKVGE